MELEAAKMIGAGVAARAPAGASDGLRLSSGNYLFLAEYLRYYFH